MAINRIDPGARMSKAVVHAGTVYLAGLTANDPKADMATQTQQVLENIENYLQQAGSSKSNLLSAVIYITDMRNFQTMNTVWDAWVDSDNTPARATVEVRLANPDLLVEIMIIAAIP